jgi:hypothetical protein
LFCLEEEEKRNPPRLEGVCEADETYLRERYQGEKLPADFWRRPRKHGAVAAKPGLSREYLCVCAGVEREGGAVSEAVSRAAARTWFYGKLLPAVLCERKENKGHFSPEKRRDEEWSL